MGPARSAALPPKVTESCGLLSVTQVCRLLACLSGLRFCLTAKNSRHSPTSFSSSSLSACAVRGLPDPWWRLGFLQLEVLSLSRCSVGGETGGRVPGRVPAPQAERMQRRRPRAPCWAAAAPRRPATTPWPATQPHPLPLRAPPGPRFVWARRPCRLPARHMAQSEAPQPVSWQSYTGACQLPDRKGWPGRLRCAPGAVCLGPWLLPSFGLPAAPALGVVLHLTFSRLLCCWHCRDLSSNGFKGGGGTGAMPAANVPARPPAARLLSRPPACLAHPAQSICCLKRAPPCSSPWQACSHPAGATVHWRPCSRCETQGGCLPAS